MMQPPIRSSAIVAGIIDKETDHFALFGGMCQGRVIEHPKVISKQYKAAQWLELSFTWQES
jgi:hypothetical protein